eukprot:Filipodium_phascolosomae@DN5749_c0_g1_i1.p1
MYEVEVYMRLAEIGTTMSRRDIIQAHGVSMGQVTWRDVIVKLLTNSCHIPMKQRVAYVGERIRWFFEKQKPVIIDFMKKIHGSADEHLYSSLYTRHVKLMDDNEIIKNLVFTTYDKVLHRQMESFVDLFTATLASTFSNPWAFLKKNSMVIDKDYRLEEELPLFDETKARIPVELETRSGIEATLSGWIGTIPVDINQVEDAVPKVCGLVNITFAYIRSQIADQMELFASSFFKLPLMRKMEEDMNWIQLSEVDLASYKSRREFLEEELKDTRSSLGSVSECLDKLQAFTLKTRAKNC